MEENKTIHDREILNPLCDSCRHLYLNNGEGIIGCRAFPDGIPDDVYGGYRHRQIYTGQVGIYVYEKIKEEELSAFMKYLRKLQ